MKCTAALSKPMNIKILTKLITLSATVVALSCFLRVVFVLFFNLHMPPHPWPYNIRRIVIIISANTVAAIGQTNKMLSADNDVGV